MTTNKTFKVEIRQDCKVCGGALPNSRYRTFCSKKCRDKNNNDKANRKQYGTIWQRAQRDKIASVPDPDKVQCLVCGKYYVQVCTHAIQVHGFKSGREYREHFELEVKRGVVPAWYRKEKGEQALENETYKNLKAGEPYRYKKGDDTNYKRSEITLERVRQLGRDQLNKKKKVINPLSTTPKKHL